MNGYKCENVQSPADDPIKGTVSRDFLLQIFSMNHLPPKPLKITLVFVQIFSKIHGDICKSRCTTGINNPGVVDTSGKLQLVLTILAENLPPVSMTSVAIATGFNDTVFL